MAWKSFTGGVANIFPAAFTAVYIRKSGEKWQTLGAINSGVMNIQDFTSPDSLTRNKAINSLDFTAKCNMMQCSLVELELLDAICAGNNDFLFRFPDSVSPAGAASAGWVMVTMAQVGCKAKVVCDGTPEDNRHIELEWQGSIYKDAGTTNITALVKPTLAAADFGSTANSDTYMGTLGVGGIGLYTAATDGGSPDPSHLKPCGVSSVVLDGAGLSSGDTMTPMTNVKLTFEMLAAQDGLRRFLPNSLDINFEWDWMTSGNADLIKLPGATDEDIKATITMLDGVVWTLDNNIGIKFNFEVSGDMDKNRVVRFSHVGKILQSSFDGIVA